MHLTTKFKNTVDALDLALSGDELNGEHSSLQISRMLPPTPLLIQYNAEVASVTLEKSGGQLTFRWPKVTRHEAVPIDAYRLRQAFLTVSSVTEALDFLNRSGWFKTKDGDTFQTKLTWEEFIAWQNMVRIRLLYGANGTPPEDNVNYSKLGEMKQSELRRFYVDRGQEEFLGGFLLKPLMTREYRGLAERSEGSLLANLGAHSTLEAILITCNADDLLGIRYGMCSLPECTNVYEVSSLHVRQYCTQAHAQRASVRRRAAQKKVNKETL